MCVPPALEDTIFNLFQVQIPPALLNVYGQLPPFFCIFHRKLPGLEHDEITFSEIQVSPFHCPLGTSQLLSFTKNKKLDKIRQGNLQSGNSKNGEVKIFYYFQSEILRVP